MRPTEKKTDGYQRKVGRGMGKMSEGEQEVQVPVME